jgi:hypothetical protein
MVLAFRMTANEVGIGKDAAVSGAFASPPVVSCGSKGNTLIEAVLNCGSVVKNS